MTTLSNVHPADLLGEFKAAIANLEAKAKVPHAALVAMGAGTHVGHIFQASVSIAPRESVDWKAIAMALKPSLKMPREYWSDQLIELVDANTTAKDVTTVRAVARTAKAA